MRREDIGEISLLHFDLESAGAITAVVTTRGGGVSDGPYESLNIGDHVGDDHGAVMENRARVCAALNVDRLTIADQQHRATVAVVTADLAGTGHFSHAEAMARLPATDAMVTDRPGIALTVMVADCAPVVLYDPDNHAVGVAHCGRGGAVLDVVGATIDSMKAHYGTRAQALLAGVGPCIAADAYEIGGAGLADTAAAFSGAHLEPTRPGHARFDLLAGVTTRLTAAGVRPDHIQTSHRTTADEVFFSDRAERPCGRFALVAILR